MILEPEVEVTGPQRGRCTGIAGPSQNPRRTVRGPRGYPSAMDPNTPPPDDSERPIRHDETAVDEDRAADDGWAVESQPSGTGAQQTADAGPTAGGPSPSPGTGAWRGPEAAGRTPASIEPAPAAEAATSTEPPPAG